MTQSKTMKNFFTGARPKLKFSPEPKLAWSSSGFDAGSKSLLKNCQVGHENFHFEYNLLTTVYEIVHRR